MTAESGRRIHKAEFKFYFLNNNRYHFSEERD